MNPFFTTHEIQNFANHASGDPNPSNHFVLDDQGHSGLGYTPSTVLPPQTGQYGSYGPASHHPVMQHTHTIDTPWRISLPLRPTGAGQSQPVAGSEPERGVPNKQINPNPCEPCRQRRQGCDGGSGKPCINCLTEGRQCDYDDIDLQVRLELVTAEDDEYKMILNLDPALPSSFMSYDMVPIRVRPTEAGLRSPEEAALGKAPVLSHNSSRLSGSPSSHHPELSEHALSHPDRWITSVNDDSGVPAPPSTSSQQSGFNIAPARMHVSLRRDHHNPDMASGPKNGKGQKQRVKLACNFCRYRKLACTEQAGDGAACSNCVKSSQRCVYMPVKGSRVDRQQQRLREYQMRQQLFVHQQQQLQQGYYPHGPHQQQPLPEFQPQMFHNDLAMSPAYPAGIDAAGGRFPEEADVLEQYTTHDPSIVRLDGISGFAPPTWNTADTSIQVGGPPSAMTVPSGASGGFFGLPASHIPPYHTDLANPFEYSVLDHSHALSSAAFSTRTKNTFVPNGFDTGSYAPTQ
ncbi:hypothetical protein QFC21_005800 [Naganishia friedmannii]|uniref:Uncharacterized protein n=1 Tax=Naganishia friedmannii TaxID=89922 RepID=A0ACC2V7S2_9TREE|nr:hypothetical protein QFC21_005800 [Naganishia friedmannii]